MLFGKVAGQNRLDEGFGKEAQNPEAGSCWGLVRLCGSKVVGLVVVWRLQYTLNIECKLEMLCIKLESLSDVWPLTPFMPRLQLDRFGGGAGLLRAVRKCLAQAKCQLRFKKVLPLNPTSK